MKGGGLMIALGKEPPSSSSKGEGGGVEDEYDAMAAEMISAVKAGDEAALASVLRSCFGSHGMEDEDY